MCIRDRYIYIPVEIRGDRKTSKGNIVDGMFAAHCSMHSCYRNLESELCNLGQAMASFTKTSKLGCAILAGCWPLFTKTFKVGLCSSCQGPPPSLNKNINADLCNFGLEAANFVQNSSMPCRSGYGKFYRNLKTRLCNVGLEPACVHTNFTSLNKNSNDGLCNSGVEPGSFYKTPETGLYKFGLEQASFFNWLVLFWSGGGQPLQKMKT